ncbi:MAG TPA: diguanylate cyclase [Magnetospirillum sp.]|nr:diguanylate cyclase [Magnetospirillum sp.]
MNRLANVLIVDERSSRAQELSQRLAKGGYHTIALAAAAEGLARAKAEHPDLVLIGDPAGADAVALASTLKGEPATVDIPVLLYADEASPELCRKALDAGLDDVLTVSCDDGELQARLRPLVRLETMHAELSQRATIAKRFGVAARDRVSGPSDTPPAVLLIGDNVGAVRALLADMGDLVVTGGLYEAEGLLGQRNFDAALIAFTTAPEGLLGFCSQVRNNPRLFNLPIVLMSEVPAADAYRRGATRVLPINTDPSILHSVMVSLVRRQQLRWSIRAALNDSLAEATRDPVTGAYSRAYFDDYVARRLEQAKAQNRHLAVVFFAAPNIDGVRRQFGDDAALHLTQQVGQWITGLLRAEDLTAAYAPNEFCVVLPDTPLAEAEVVMHRIAGVLAYTDFAVREVYQAVKVWVQVGCTDIREDDTVASLLTRARGNID